MFYKEKKSDGYYIWGDSHKWKYGPFSGVYIKNESFWNIKQDSIDLKKYPSYKYIFWTWKNMLFVIWWAWIVSFETLTDEKLS